MLLLGLLLRATIMFVCLKLASYFLSTHTIRLLAQGAKINIYSAARCQVYVVVVVVRMNRVRAILIEQLYL